MRRTRKKTFRLRARNHHTKRMSEKTLRSKARNYHARTARGWQSHREGDKLARKP